MRKFLALTLLVILTSCSSSSTSTSTSATPHADDESFVTESEVVVPTADTSIGNKAKSCICVKIWMPVCGENNKTYGNSCEADCAGVKYTQGACKAKAKKK